MAGPKKKQKLTKPGLDYKIEKALTTLANATWDVGVHLKPIQTIARKIFKIPEDKFADKRVIGLNAKETAKLMKNINKKKLQKKRVESIKKQKKKP